MVKKSNLNCKDLEAKMDQLKNDLEEQNVKNKELLSRIEEFLNQ